MRKSRFQQEISGELGDFWKGSAERDLEDLRNDLKKGDLVIDENGVARNKLGRAVMSDLLEMIAYINDEVNVEATKKAREEEVSASISEYRANYRGPRPEELVEMRAEFGSGETVVNILTGTEVYL